MIKLLLFIHLVFAACALATSVHLLMRLWRYGLTHGVYIPQIRMHSLMAGGFYAASFFLGAIIYPAFRVDVRAALFDAEMPWLTGIFEIKEHLAAIGIVPAIAIIVMGRVLDFHCPTDRRFMPIFAGLAAVVLMVIMFNAGAGWYLSSVRSL